jgi:adenylate kinase
MRANGEPLRPDDNPDVLKQRLAAHRAQTAPLATYYRGKGSLHSVDGMVAIDEVRAAIGRALADAAFRGAPEGSAGQAVKGSGLTKVSRATKVPGPKSASAQRVAGKKAVAGKARPSKISAESGVKAESGARSVRSSAKDAAKRQVKPRSEAKSAGRGKGLSRAKTKLRSQKVGRKTSRPERLTK